MNRDEGSPRGNRPRGGNWRSRKKPQNQESHQSQSQSQSRYIPRTSHQSQDGSNNAPGTYNRRRNNRQYGSGRIQIPADTGDTEQFHSTYINHHQQSQQPQYQYPPQYQQPQQNSNRERGNRGAYSSNQNTATTVQHDDSQASSSRNTRHREPNKVENQGKTKPAFDPLCYSNLLKLVKSQNNIDIVHVLANGQNGFHQFIQEKLRPDLFILIMKALKKVCDSDLDESKTNILSQACSESAFTDQFLIQLMTAESRPPEELKDLILNMITFFETVARLLPLTACDSLKHTILGCHCCSETLNTKKNLQLDAETLQRFQIILTDLEEIKVKNPDTGALKKKSINERLQLCPPPNDFREISVYPTPEDVLSREKPFLRPNIINGPYENVDHYLDVQFRLLKEDFTRPLREGIEAYISGDKKLQKNSSVKVYKDVRFIRSEDEKQIKNQRRTKEVEGTLVNFDPNKKFAKVDWEHNRRFMHGSLLCFSQDNFNTLLVTQVCDRDIKNLELGLLRVEFCQQYNENIYRSKYLMLESEIFFDPYYHVLKTLQSLTDENFPMAEYLIGCQEDDFVPKYLEQEARVQYKLPMGRQPEIPIIVLNRKTWPSAEELDLDKTQFEALHAALTRELVIIQGPPGTGKTFIGLKIAEILINNKEATERKTPILVVCLTNHALDQFLMGIMKTTQKIVRIGGQSKCEEMANFNLKLVRRQSKSREYMRQLFNLKQEIGQLNHQMSVFDSYLRTVQQNVGIVAYDILCKENILPDQAAQDLSNGQFLIWLLEADQDQERRDHLEINGIKFELLMEEFVHKHQELEQQKDTADDYNLRIIEYQQNEVNDAKEWIETKLQNKEVPTNHQINTWVRNVWALDSVQRWKLYFYWLQRLEEIWLIEIRKIENVIIGKNKELGEMQTVEDLELLRGCDVVGMTTNGAARLHSMLRKLGPEIVIVEEAAEVMESHVVSCLTQRCQHLILIGDHKQLRPTVAVYQLAKDFHLDVSLFERMVMNREQCVTLGVQHRMAPAIAELITPTIYKQLENADSVKWYPAIPGLPQRLFFVNHDHPEEMMDLDSNSRINRHESDFIIALCRHLILQGCKPTDITILTTYRGQMFYIKKEMKKWESIKGVLATVVDNYQGEENKIILLSLVRSNTEKHIGFLSTPNRICVALSRAQHAMYIIGNMNGLTEAAKVKPENNIWKHINASLEKQSAVGPALPLRCQVHYDQAFSVASAKDFKEKAPEGGCNQICTSELECGHLCNRVCHALARDHVDMKCLSICGQLCKNQTHNCEKKCYEPCGECTVIVPKELPCKHVRRLMCHIETHQIRCDVMVQKMFVACEHVAKVKCCIDPETGKCPLPCDTRLDCGHQCILSCHANDDPDHLQYICKKPCARRNLNCKADHKCGKLCCDECSICKVKVPKKKKCGHSYDMECSTDPEDVLCKVICNKIMKCSHLCKLKCCEPCGSCQEIVTKTIPSCGHEVQIECGKTPLRSSCTNMKCERLLSCLHPCTEPCGKPCASKCTAEVAKTRGVCGHNVPLLCWEYQKGLQVPTSSSRCSEPCNTVLQCGHLCPGTCGKCHQGRFHELCDQPCGRVLVCGHPCKEPCAEICPPCKEKCGYKCQHSKCPKKCGEPCVPCKEKCGWSCPHRRCKRKCGEPCDCDPCDEPCPKKRKCGHGCIGFCGEPCPTLCRICDQEELTQILFGNEDEPDARFVLLPDCGHSIEVGGLQTWIQQDSNVVAMKVCPLCKSEIKKVPRFNCEVKQAYKDISKVKSKTFGNPKTIELKRKQLENEMTQLLQSDNTQESFVELHWCLQETLKSVQQTTVKGRKNVLSNTSIAIKATEVDILTRICEVWKKCKPLSSLKEELKTHVNLLLENLEAKKHRMGQQQVDDFKLEILRLQRIAQYLAFKIKASDHPNIIPLLDKFRAQILDVTSRFSQQKNAGADILYQQLQELTKNLPGLGIDEFERLQIVGALNLQRGHWFKCPNGHPYIITECGGAMQESTCPECKCKIGGGSHALRADNAHFALMDRSQYARYSEQANNMANFDFNAFQN